MLRWHPPAGAIHGCVLAALNLEVDFTISAKNDFYPNLSLDSIPCRYLLLNVPLVSQITTFPESRSNASYIHMFFIFGILFHLPPLFPYRTALRIPISVAFAATTYAICIMDRHD